jgi:hypothetical protein
MGETPTTEEQHMRTLLIVWTLFAGDTEHGFTPIGAFDDRSACEDARGQAYVQDDVDLDWLTCVETYGVEPVTDTPA